jgi:ABC-type transport system substrate-binding protein/serine/threonine protein kinase
MLGEKLADRYEIVSELGRGGMGVVYRARDPLLDREVAVKVIAPAMLTDDTEQRFQTEAQVVARMDHPSIVTIYDFGRHEGSLFFVMPIIGGESLRHHLRRQSLRLGSVIDIGIEIAEALDYSHALDIVHRDIKPENIMVSLDEAGGARVRIMDFGLAHGGNVSSLTKTGMLVGTMSYISPEQVSSGGIDGRSDIYSLGSVLYECLVNEVPFTGEMQAVLFRIVHELPQGPRDLGAEIDSELEEIIMGCLAKSPEKRPQTGAELARALRHYSARLQDSQKLLSVMMTHTMLAPRPALSPLTGREPEMKELQQRLNAAVRGECQFAVVSGEPGVGKTRLLDELETLASARQIRVLHGRFVEQQGSFPYHGFCEAIQEFFRQTEAGSSSNVLPDFTDLASDLIALFPMLAEIEPIRTAASGDSRLLQSDETRTPENQTQIFELLARTLTQLAGGKPLLLLFEDLHEAQVSIEALQYIVRRLGPTPTLIVGTYRSPEVDRSHPIVQMLEGFQGDRRFAALELGPFSGSEFKTFLGTLTGGTEFANELAEQIFEATEGNPFFTKELMRSLLDAGTIAQDDTGSWQLSGGMEIASDALPATIQQAVERRIGRLPDDLRSVLSVASVMGKSFEFDDLEALSGSDGDLDDAVDRFVQEGLLEEDRQSRGDRLAFSSGVVREVLYAELSRRKRRSLHRKYAARLEKRNAGRLERAYPQLVFHFSEGDVPEKTVEYGLLHASRALEAFSPLEVIRSTKAALEFLDEEWEGDAALEGETRMLLSAGYRMNRDIPAALKEIDSAIKVFERENHPDRVIAGLLVAAKSAWQMRQIDETAKWVARGIAAARSHDDKESLAQFLNLAATLANLRGEYAKGSEYLRESESLQDTADDSKERNIMPQGGTLTVALANPIVAHRPVEMQLTEEYEVFANVYETLLSTDEEGNLHPALCESWQVLDNGRSFKFKLRSDVRFSDDQPLNAQSVKESIEQALVGLADTETDLPPAYAAIRGSSELAQGTIEALEAIIVHSDEEVEIQLSDVLPIYPALLTDGRAAVCRPNPQPESGLTTPLGTGPFRFTERTPHLVKLERDPMYWKGALPNIDGIEFLIRSNAAIIARGFRDGELDIARDLLPEDLTDILHDPQHQGRFIEKPQRFTYFVLFNSINGPMTANSAVRKSLAGVVRARDLVWRKLGRFAEPASGLIPQGILGHDPGRRHRGISVDEARQILREAGVEEKLQLRAAVHPLIRDRFGALLEGLFEAWSELGIEVSVETTDAESYLKAWHDNSNFDLIIARWRPDFDDPDDCTHSLFNSNGGMFRSYFSSPESDEILETARREVRTEARENLYRTFESNLLESSHFVPLFQDIGYRLVSHRVEGCKLISGPPYVNYSELGKAEAVASTLQADISTGGTLQIPIPGTMNILDPSIITTVDEVEVLSSVYETLMRDMGEAKIAPWLAESCKAEDGGKKYRFRLRKNVRFHDGRRLSARDVRYSVEHLLLNGNPEGWMYSMIRGAKDLLEGNALDLAGFQIQSNSEFTIELETPIAFFPALLANPLVAIVPEGSDRFGPSWKDGSVGTGAFRIIQFDSGRRLELERNPLYWRKNYPKSDGLVFNIGVSPEEILDGLQAGRFSIASGLYPADVEKLRRNPKYAAGYREAPTLSTYYAGFNVNQGPLKDPALRRRLVKAVNVAAVVQRTLRNLAVPAKGWIPPGLLGHDSQGITSDTMVAPSDTEATEAFEVELRAAIHPIFTGEFAGFAEEIWKAFRRVGVIIKPVTESMEDFLDQSTRGTVDISVGRWVADYADSDVFGYQMNTHSGMFGKMSGTAELDKLIEQGRIETNPRERHAIYRRIEEIIARDALLLPLFHEQIYRFASPDLEGFSLYSSPAVAYDELRFKRG